MAEIIVDGVRYELSEDTFTAKVGAVEHEHEFMKSYTIPETLTADGNTFQVTMIGAEAFNNCPLLEEVIIPDSVTEIEDGRKVDIFIFLDELCSAFRKCQSLKSIKLPNNLKKIGRGAFSCCTGLTSIDIPNSVTELAGFTHCIGLKSIGIPNNVTVLAGFNGCTGLKSIDIPNSVTKIRGFRGCNGLTSVTIPNSVKDFGRYAFNDCQNLKSVIIENERDAVRIHENAFNNTNAKITYLGKPESVSGNIYENYLKTKEISKSNLKELLSDNMILGHLINDEELFIHSNDNKNLTPIKNNFFLNIRNAFQTAGVPIHIVSGEQLDYIYRDEHKERQESNFYRAVNLDEPLGVFVSKQQAIYLAGDRISLVANSIGISYTHLAYIVRIHEIMHWVFQWKEKPKFARRRRRREYEDFTPSMYERFTILPYGWHNQPRYGFGSHEYEYFIPCEYEYIEESMANYMTLLWIDWLKRHIDDCPIEKFLLDQNNLYQDAIKFMSTQPEAYAVAVPLYEKCNPFNGNYVLPFLNWCFQKNSIEDDNGRKLVGKLCNFYRDSEKYDAEEILNWYRDLFI
ncbi:MAG: leucine-rich repeat protein [Bacteroidales bacterium]|nr:leucine-rich repeat protein [Bacteroidales bacterium]